MAIRQFILAIGSALALASCGGETSEPETIKATIDDPAEAPVAQDGEADPSVIAAAQEATPMEDRIATIGLLNKRNNLSQDFQLRPGESIEDGPVILTLAACERTAPWEMPQETGAFVQVDIQNRRDSDHTRVFSGWLFKESPSLNVVEHPIYDVWVKDCAMSFPGDE